MNGCDENDRQVNGFRNVLDRREAGKPFYFSILGIDGVNPSLESRLQVFENSITPFKGFGGCSDDGNALRIEK